MKKLLKDLYTGKALEKIIWKGMNIEKHDSFKELIMASIGRIILCLYIKSNLQTIVKNLINLKSSTSTYNEYMDEYNKMKDFYETIRETDYSTNKWMVLSYYFIQNCMFSLAYICRQKAKKRLYSSKRITYKVILGYIEDANFEKALECISIMKDRWRGKILFDELVLCENFIKMLKGQEYKFLKDESYYNYIKMKKIAIVGPTISISDMVKIDQVKEADVLIRNNVQIHQNIESIKINVTYCNSEWLQMVSDKGDIEKYQKTFDWVCVKHEERIIRIDSGNIHRTPDVNKLFYSGAANMLPFMIADLLFHDVDELFICGNNLFLTKVFHSKDYIFQTSTEAMKNAFVVHDLLSQHIFLSMIYRYEKFIADEELSDVLSKTTMEYAEEMEKLYT